MVRVDHCGSINVGDHATSNSRGDNNMHITVPADSCESARSQLRGARRACCAAALALAQLLAHGTAMAAEPRTWIVGATVISAERADDGRKLNVLIEGDRIAAVVDELPPKAAQDAVMVDAAGAYLIPGLIDSHVHLQTVPGLSPLMEFRHPFLVRDYRAQLPRSFLRYGYTTVIDLVPTSRGVLDAFVAAPAHPDLYHCGALPVADGYPSHYAPSLVRSRVFPNFVVDPKSARGADAHEHSPQAAVDRVKQQGAICIKTFFERGFGRDHDLPVPSPELFANIMKSGRSAGMPVLLHASSLEAQRFGVDGGVNIFVHGMWNWNAFNESAALPDPVREVLDQIATRRIGYMPTMQVLGGLRVLFEPDYFDRAGVRRVVPQSLLEWYRSSDGQWFKNDLAGGKTDAQMRSGLDSVLRRGAESTRYLARKGALFLFGSDTPSGPTPGNLPGLNGYMEMQRLVAANMSLRQLLEAATINNAKAFGLADRVGTIEVGKRANLLLLSRSPLESVEAYDSIRSLWIGGRRLDPAGLEAGK
jgi:imidazolonepropionase-like amidohydrolase